MASSNGQRLSFFPKVDASVLQSKHEPPAVRPQDVGPIFDTENADQPLLPWTIKATNSAYPPRIEDYAPASIPDMPQCLSERYLYPQLTRNERLRLTMLWYYTRDILKDHELLSRLQEKTSLVQETIGWEFVIIGVLDINTYTRLATFGLPLAILPRRESTCAHTVHQPPGTVFLLPNMAEDWRFQKSPHVDIGGLRSYSGVPLRFETEFGDCVAFGSLCVASNTCQEALTRGDQITLTHFADWVVADIIHSARARRQRERRCMVELISSAQKKADENVEEGEEAVLNILTTIYPKAAIKVQLSRDSLILLEGRDPITPADLQGGLWEDIDYIEDVIENKNYQEPPSTKVVRVIATQCQSTPVSSFLVVASKDFRLVFDDVDSWFVQTCAGILSQIWHQQLLAEAMVAKERFLRGFSHQLRTPIHGILGSVDLLAEELQQRNQLDIVSSREVTTTAKETDPFVYINTIKSAGKDLISIVNSMITLNRWADIAISERNNTLHNINDLEIKFLGEMTKGLPGAVQQNPSIFIQHELSSNHDSVWVDFNLLMHSLLPIVQNAIQNTPEGVVVITTSIRAETKELIVDIEDTGCGIRPDYHQRIFDAYEKVDVHSIGAGLGLTLASKFARLLGGSVVLMSSVIGQGSHFRATIGDVMCSSNGPSQKEFQSKLKDTPKTFYKISSGPGGVSLCDYFANFLTYHGFTSSRNILGSLIILDFVRDRERRRSCFSQVPPNQVAICLVPASESTVSSDDIPKNILCVRGPFLTSTLSAALEEADALFIKVKDTPKPLSLLNHIAATLPGLRMDDAPRLESPSGNESNTTTDLEDPEPDASGLRPAERMAAAFVETDAVVSTIPILARSSTPAALLVDDNNINLRIMKMYCNKRKLPFHCATDGLQAVELFSQHQSSCATTGKAWIELVLMDLQMPVCDGVEATRKIRLLEKQNQWKRCVLFMVTGQDSPVDRAVSEDAGADEYLVKPVGIGILDRAVKKYFPGFKPS